MIRKLTCLLSVVLLCALLTGCADLTSMMSGGTAEEPTPTGTPLPPLAEPMYEDADALYKYYNQVNLGDTLTDLTERFGEPVKEETSGGDSYVWVMDDGYGFAAVFFDNGKLRGKVLYYTDIRRLCKLSGATHLDQVFSLNKQCDLSMARSMLGGSALEISLIAQDSTVNPEVNRLYIWGDKNEDVVQILFDNKNMLSQVSYSMQ